MVSVEVWLAEPLTVTDAGERLQVAGSFAAAGLMAQVKLTAPENPPEPLTVIVELFPVPAPGSRLMLPPFVRANEETIGVVTVRSTAVVRLVEPAAAVTVAT
jgi:hypothetical protein